MPAKRNSRSSSRRGVPSRTTAKKRGKAVPAITALQLAFSDQRAWQEWLHKNHATEREIWIQMAKVASGIQSVTHSEALEIALCYGWIDGRIQPLDENYTLRRFIPRRKDSIWSRINREKALQLIEQGRMHPAGFAAIEQAKANSRWHNAYQPTSDTSIPPDLKKALKKSPKAAAVFKSIDRKNRYAVVFRLQTAKKPETRAARLAKFIAMLERGQKLI